MFIDEAIIWVRSGKGGNGCVSFRREKYVPRGGPNGGNGGRGGHVFLVADSSLTTLLDVGRRKHYLAASGQQGMGSDRNGRKGRDLRIRVPLGTVVREVLPEREPREGRLLGELLHEGDSVRVARGGKGGRGNKFFATAIEQAPRRAEEGESLEERQVYLELKLVADVGLVGLPNAGKSTLLSCVSKATPKIANYPFTTLAPQLGIVELPDYRRLVMADIPGLIEGAHVGHGLGIEFLRHVERTRVLLHLVSVEELDPDLLVANCEMIERELITFSSSLAEKPRILVLTKMDLITDVEGAKITKELTRRLGRRVYPISAVTRVGLKDLLDVASQFVDSERRAKTDLSD